MKSTGHDGTDTRIRNMAIGYFPDGMTGVKQSFKMDWSNKTGQASIYSTTGDMHKFYSALFGEKIITKKSLEKMCTGFAKSNVGTYGYGIFVNEGNIYSFNGRSPGFSSEVRYYDGPDKVFMVILSNNYSAPVLRMMNKIATIYLGGTYNDLTIGQPVTLTDKILTNYIGTYKGGADFIIPNVDLKVESKHDYLLIRWKLSGSRESILIPQSENTFLDKTFWAMVRFEHDPDKKSNRLVYTSFGKEYAADKVD